MKTTYKTPGLITPVSNMVAPHEHGNDADWKTHLSKKTSKKVRQVKKKYFEDFPSLPSPSGSVANLHFSDSSAAKNKRCNHVSGLCGSFHMIWSNKNHNKNKKIYKNNELNLKKEEQKKERSARFDDDKMELISVSSTKSDYTFKFDDEKYKEDDDDSLNLFDSEDEIGSIDCTKKIKMECDSVEFAYSVTHTP